VRRGPAALVLVALLAACGQKAGVHESASTALAAGAAGAGAAAPPEVGTETTVPAVAGAAAAAPPGSVAGGGAPPTGGPATTAAVRAAAGDRTGVTDAVIKIGIHAPVTGAAPFPQTSFSRGAGVYWQWLAQRGGVFGRKVEVVFEDDQFNPATAKRVCEKMVTQDKVFLLIGGGGADQITACAQYAQSAGVPYLAAGVNEKGFVGLSHAYAVSMTYAQQSPLLAQLVKTRFGGKKLAIVVADTPSFDDAASSMGKAARDAGITIVHEGRIPKDASQTEALAIANTLRTKGAEVVYLLSSPETFLNIAAAATGQAYNPQYVGPGVSSGLNLVAQIGCPAIGEARFLSPFPQLDVIDRLDGDFRPAYRAATGQEPDDIGIALWGIGKSLNQVFLAAGKDLTRQSFEAALQSGRTFQTNVFPPARFTASEHRGASQAHLLKADCGGRRFVTEAPFASGF
jgi:branched-chain amino acid transport system substrate-binding protein